MKDLSNYSKEELYKIFLSKIDDLSRIRLESIDMSLSIYQMKFTNIGYILTETSCYNKKNMIKRNQMGFYVDETSSLKSEEEFNNYNESVIFLKKYKSVFKIIDGLLKDKEAIMNGYYETSYNNMTDLEIIVKLLGYGSIRKQEIEEDNPFHPSKDYKMIISFIEKSKDEKNYKSLKYEIIEYLNSIFGSRYEIKIKYKKDKYGYDFDPEYGVLINDLETGDKRMLYGVTDYMIYKDDYKKYEFINPNYLEICLKIITKCIK